MAQRSSGPHIYLHPAACTWQSVRAHDRFRLGLCFSKFRYAENRAKLPESLLLPGCASGAPREPVWIPKRHSLPTHPPQRA